MNINLKECNLFSMPKLLIPLLAALVLTTAVNANRRVSSEISVIEANKIFLGQVLSIC